MPSIEKPTPVRPGGGVIQAGSSVCEWYRTIGYPETMSYTIDLYLAPYQRQFCAYDKDMVSLSSQ